MKRQIIKLILLCVAMTQQVSPLHAQLTSEDMLRSTFDSSQVEIAVIDTLRQELSEDIQMVPQIAQPSSFIDYTLDKTRIVGDVPYELGTTIAGQVELIIPIETFASEYESSPQVTLKYTSQNGMTCMGNGWDITGLSKIELTNKNYFTDGNTSGKNYTNGPWSIDGIRLIQQEGNDSISVFLSQIGNIRVTHEIYGIHGYNAYLPNGTVCQYNTTGADRAWYISKTTTLDGKEVTYWYDYDHNLQFIRKIDYGEGRSLNFIYDNAQNEQTVYVDGVAMTYRKKLSMVEVKKNDHILRQYVMTYRDGDITAPMVQIDMLDSIGNAVNPLKLQYYGDNAYNGAVDHNTRVLAASFHFTNPNQFVSLRGKLNDETEDDAIIMYPNKYSYYKDGYHRVISSYGIEDTIAINYDLNNIISESYDKLAVGQGFVSTFCMDMDGLHGEELIKVNQNVDKIGSQHLDHVTFDIYKKGSPRLNHVKTYHLYLNALKRNSHYSIWPSHFLAGDFTGDGREEVLLCRSASPLNHEEDAQILMIDLNQNAILYQGLLDAFQLYIPGSPYSDSENLERDKNSDRLFATDLDGDGKLEMCVLTTTGLDIYRFSYNNSGSVIMTKSNSQDLTLSQAHDYIVNVGDMNGDGNTDLIYVPRTENHTLISYLSKADDHFIAQSTAIQSDQKTDFMCFDFNQDGHTDVMKYYKYNYIDEVINGEHYGLYSQIYILKNGGTIDTIYINRATPSILVPISLFGGSSNVTLMSIKSNGLYDGYRCRYPMTMDALLTGMMDSRGCTASIMYKQLYPNNCYLTDYDATFPFSTFSGSKFVCNQMTKISNSHIDSNISLSYQNATIHKQGLGFCGFRSIVATDLLRNESTVQTFNPEKFGVSVSVTSPREQICYTYQTALSNDKRIKALLTSVDKTDLVTGAETFGAYTYDSYGNMLSESTTSGSITKTVTNTYQNLDTGNNWIIGAELSHVESVTRDNQTITSGRTTKYKADWLPDTIIIWRESEQSPVSTKIIKYDSQKRPTRIKTRAYSGTELKRYIDYQGTSRIPKGIRDEKGIYNSMVYGDFGVIQLQVKPELLVRPDENDFPVIPMDPVGPMGGSDGVNGHGPSVVIGPNLLDLQPLTTLYHYDTFGRQDTVTTPDGIQKTITYSWVDDDSSDALIMVENNETGHAASRTWFDASGRKVQSAQQRFDDRWSNVFYEYDDLGRLASASQPTLTTSPSQWITYTYDAFDRLVEKEYPDEHVDTYSYSGLSTTSTIDGVTSTRTFDESGNLVEVNDGGGRIEYTLRPDGQPSEIRVGGSIATTFEYDQYGRRTSINDPSAGCRTTTYDNNGNVQCEMDARGKSVASVYNAKGLLTSRTFSDGLSVTFAYDQWNAPTSMTGSDGRSKTWTYNDQRRLSTEIIDGFKKTYSYTGNQLSSVAYFKNNSHICSENHNHTNGHLTSITLNTGDTIWTLRKQNSRFLPTKVGLGKLETSLSYDLRGNVSNRRTVFCVNNTNTTKQDIAYTYDLETGNMSSRLDWFTMLRESFGYDGMNRLTDISLYEGLSCLSELETLYDGKGNILSRADAGQYGYNPSLPYGINELTSPGTSIPMRDQYLHFNAMQLPDTICENGYTATFSYYGDQTRAVMVVTGPEAYRFECEYYDQQYNEFSKTVGNVTSYKSVLWLGGSPYSAPAALLKDYGESNWQLVHVLRDNLGSITHVIDTTGVVLQELAYTAWGQLRDPQTALVYSPDNQPELLLGRGYTGHEHLPWFGLINMNARLYDPAVGRFLNPDPIVQAPDNTQNFNRYSYCMNNPLCYVDKDGKFWHLIIGGLIGGVLNWATHGCKFNAKGLGYFVTGAVAGAVGAGVGAGISSALAGSSFGAGFIGSSAAMTATTSFISGVAIGGGAGFSAGFTTGFGNGLMDGQNFGQALWSGVKDGLIGGVSGALLGGIAGGIDAAANGRNFWHGGRKILDLNLPIPQVNQVGQYDCNYACAESVDSYYGNGRDQSYFQALEPGNGQGLTDSEIGRMYGRAGYSAREISINTSDPVSTISDIANTMNENKAVVLNYNTGISGGVNSAGQKIVFGHATVITRIRLYDNGRFIINVMNPGGSTTSFKNINSLHLIFGVY